MNPCDIPCPKCGSLDITRRFFANDSIIENEEYGVAPCAWSCGDAYSYRASRDLIKHHCRCCRHGWVSKPLPKTRRTQLNTGDAP